MKPSEILGLIGELLFKAQTADDAAKDYDDKATMHRQRANSLRGQHRMIMANVDSGTPWPEIEAALFATSSEPEIVVSEEKPTRKRRSDKDVKRGPKITKEQRDARDTSIEATREVERLRLLPIVAGHGPETLSALRVEIANHPGKQYDDDMALESALCDHPETFIPWMAQRPGDKIPMPIWGTAEQFDQAVGSMTLQCSKADRPRYTSAALNCSVKAALESWRRLDPDQARKEAAT